MDLINATIENITPYKTANTPQPTDAFKSICIRTTILLKHNINQIIPIIDITLRVFILFLINY